MRRLYDDDPPDDISDCPDGWERESDLPAETCPMSEADVRRVAELLGLNDLDEPGAWWCEQLDLGELDEPFETAAE